MLISQLINNLHIVKRTSEQDVQIESVVSDSRHVQNNSLFVAVCGVASDGHDFIAQAEHAGAVAVVAEKIPEQYSPHVQYIIVPDSAEALGLLASAFYGNPSHFLTVVGVTGTNGKTTVATLLYRLFSALGYRTGLISTVRNYIHDSSIDATHTTPDALSLQKLFVQMLDAGCTHCFMEVSSHAIHQRRISGIRFDGGIFTNLTRDHLDYHLDFKNYRDAKKGFFDCLDSEAFALTNGDDANGSFMLQNTRARKLVYAIKSSAQYKTQILENTIEGLLLRMGGREVHFQLRGKFNAYNLLAVYGAAMELHGDAERILCEMSGFAHVDGRFESVKNSQNIHAIVDYAHTPDAVANVLETIDDIRTHNERLFVVIGAGGNRDAGKRPQMAAIAANFAGLLILTSDNPRNEDPLQILSDMKAGVSKEHESKTLVIPDREEAIKTACFMAQKGDIILVAGKGHETYQEIKGVRFHFDDKEILGKYLNR